MKREYSVVINKDDFTAYVPGFGITVHGRDVEDCIEAAREAICLCGIPIDETLPEKNIGKFCTNDENTLIATVSFDLDV